jgi:hypothetical protein
MHAKTAVHAKQVSHCLNPRLRSSEAESLPDSEDTAVCGGFTEAAESGSAILGIEEPDRVATCAPAQDQVCTGTVLLSRRGAEPEAVGFYRYLSIPSVKRAELRRTQFLVLLINFYL